MKMYEQLYSYVFSNTWILFVQYLRDEAIAIGLSRC